MPWISNRGGDKRVFKGKNSSRSKSRGNKPPLRFFICHKERHFKYNFLEREKKYKDKDRESSFANASVTEDGYNIANVFIVMKNTHMRNRYKILDVPTI